MRDRIAAHERIHSQPDAVGVSISARGNRNGRSPLLRGPALLHARLAAGAEPALRERGPVSTEAIGRSPIAALFPGIEIAGAASVAIVRARVDLVVAKFRDGAKHCVCGRSVMNPGSVSAVAERHGAEDDVSDRCFGHSNRLASLSMAAP